MQRGHFNDPDLHYPGLDPVKQGLTLFLFGEWGTWKTSFAGQCPKPVFLSAGIEGGDDSLALLPELYGLPEPPPSYRITGTAMMQNKVDLVTTRYAEMDVNTVVVDSITYYVDIWIQELMKQRYDDPKVRARIEKRGGAATIMEMQDWGVLAMHIRDLAVKLHNSPLNIVWIAGQADVVARDGSGNSRVIGVEPMIKGETRFKLPGMCKMIVQAAREMQPDPQAKGRMKIVPAFYTSPTTMCTMLRHKFGNAFPEGRIADPEYGNMPTFRALYERVGQYMYVT